MMTKRVRSLFSNRVIRIIRSLRRSVKYKRKKLNRVEKATNFLFLVGPPARNEELVERIRGCFNPSCYSKFIRNAVIKAARLNSWVKLWRRWGGAGVADLRLIPIKNHFITGRPPGKLKVNLGGGGGGQIIFSARAETEEKEGG